jgi:hypothetical protein
MAGPLRGDAGGDSAEGRPVNRFPDFGKELQGPFEVHENCYDCAALYDGCQGWRA